MEKNEKKRILIFSNVVISSQGFMDWTGTCNWIFTLINDGEVLTANSFLATYGFTVLGLVLFYYFSQSKRDISIKEGIILMSVYLFFVFYELGKATLFIK